MAVAAKVVSAVLLTDRKRRQCLVQWEGGGLGKYGQGIFLPIEVNTCPANNLLTTNIVIASQEPYEENEEDEALSRPMKKKKIEHVTNNNDFYLVEIEENNDDLKRKQVDGLEHLQKAYNTNKAAFKAHHWVIDRTTRTYNVEKIRWERPENITASEWDKHIEFWNDPGNIARAAKNRQNRAKSTVISRQGSRSLARLRDEMRQTSTTQEYPSLIDTFFMAHTVNGEFLRDEDRRIYEKMRRLETMGTYTDDEINRLARGGVVTKQLDSAKGKDTYYMQKDEMLRLQGLGSNTPTGVPYTEDEIMAIVRGGKQLGLKKREKLLTKQVTIFMRLFRSDDKFSQMLTQLESQPEYGGGNESGGCEDDETGDDEDDGEDEEEDDS
uniref:F-box domain, leucine-rich repeat domain, L domain-like protein n=1 Tax=Tanacetum cinerariifolium TaxID=118510 RepID=A0A6L2NVQ1_TANCI|nr:hypothetical protein [Tanacetum cinerariifolium]